MSIDNRKTWKLKRLISLKKEMFEYFDAEKEVPIHLLAEYNLLLRELDRDDYKNLINKIWRD